MAEDRNKIMVPTSRAIVPSKLYRVKVFESEENFKKSGDGWERLPLDSDETLEQQMNSWVDSTKNLVVGLGPVTVVAKETKTKLKERRTLALTYVPAVEQGTQIYGQAPQTVPERPLVEPVKPEGSTSAPRISDGPRGGLRTPTVAG